MSTKLGGGLTVIRDAVFARKSQHVLISRECGCSIMLLESFAEGRADLNIDVLQEVVKFIWQYIEYNPELDALQSIPQPPARSIGVRPTWKIDLPKYKMGPCERGGPQPVEPAPPKPKRVGWAGGWQ